MSEQPEVGHPEDAGQGLLDRYWEIIRYRRGLAKASQKDTAFAADVSRTTLINVEKGHSGPVPEPATVASIMAALGCAVVEGRAEVAYYEALTPQMVGRLIELVTQIRKTDELKAALAARTYRAYVDTWSSLGQLPETGMADADVWQDRMEQAQREALTSLQTFVVPHLRAGEPTDDALLARFDLADFESRFGPEAKERSRREGELAMREWQALPEEVRKATSFATYKPTGRVPIPKAEVEELREKLAVAEERQMLAERNAAIEHQHAEEARRELAAIRTDSAAAQAFAQLPKEVQDLLRTGHLHDWKVIEGAGMRHVRLTLRGEEDAPVTARDIMEQAVHVDFALLGSMMVIRTLQEHNWDYQKAMKQMPTALRELAQQAQVAADWLRNPTTTQKQEPGGD
ncbi:helix-turn-helix domain-containing protein [Nonomuraea sp. CA-143628]|uniref:helix-turn-helix domain-containing protein n=1 Tax=Nonomuraea sp. CA-143628 TaxID=3239997 RepID=UPI003D8F2C81